VSDDIYGTVDRDAPVTRAELERAIRHLTLVDLDLRDAILQVGARMIALTDELTRRLDGVEPDPAPPGTPAAEPTHTVEHAVILATPHALAQVRAGDAADLRRIQLDMGADKYGVEPAAPPCAEVIDLCQARCCTFDFALSSADLDEGVIRWDHGQPYLIRKRASDRYCVHNHPSSRACTVHAYRPRPCRSYDCRDDPRVWIDYEQRIPAPIESSRVRPEPTEATGFDLMERARTWAATIATERMAVAASHADDEPRPGPRPRPRPR
jgi:hypothetical protein